MISGWLSGSHRDPSFCSYWLDNAQPEIDRLVCHLSGAHRSVLHTNRGTVRGGTPLRLYSH